MIVKLTMATQSRIELGSDQFILVETINESGSITSNLKEKGERAYNLGIDVLESIVLAHACAGVDVADPKYVEGLKSALEGMANNL